MLQHRETKSDPKTIWNRCKYKAAATLLNAAFDYSPRQMLQLRAIVALGWLEHRADTRQVWRSASGVNLEVQCTLFKPRAKPHFACGASDCMYQQAFEDVIEPSGVRINESI